MDMTGEKRRDRGLGLFYADHWSSFCMKEMVESVGQLATVVANTVYTTQ